AAYDRVSAFRAVLDGEFGDPLQIASGAVTINVEDREDPASGVLIPEVGEQDRRRVIAAALVEEARDTTARERFLNWEIAFPHIWRNLASAAPAGGFDAVIGNPPYVRQELLGAMKPALKASYACYDGVADLYVYFYEQGLRLLRPGGRMSYVVTDKWLKAAYAEQLRALFCDPATADVAFIADFGHAKHFFPDADVFPSVIVVRRPDRTEPRDDIEVCVIPRDAVPTKGLADAVAEASFKLPRAMFTKDSWTLEPKPVMELIERIKQIGVPLAEYTGNQPFMGVKTGLNEAFLIDAKTRDRLVSADSKCAALMRPYLRGQDIDRWSPSAADLSMIMLKSSGDFDWPWTAAADEAAAEASFRGAYPSLYAHFKKLESYVDPKTGK